MLVLWEYFWEPSDWTLAPSVSVEAVVVIDLGAGGGGHKKDSYWPLPDEFWEERETHMKRGLPPEKPKEKNDEEDKPMSRKDRAKLASLQQQRAILNAQTSSRTNKIASLQLTLDISRLLDKYDLTENES